MIDYLFIHMLIEIKLSIYLISSLVTSLVKTLIWRKNVDSDNYELRSDGRVSVQNAVWGFPTPEAYKIERFDGNWKFKGFEGYYN